MKLLLLFCLLAAAQAYYLSDQFIDHLNKVQSSWTAARNFHENTPLSYFKRINGVKKHPTGYTLPMKIKTSVSSDLPDTYDTRTAYPYCTTASFIRDQGGCASDWVLAAVEVMSDRYCIQLQGTLLNISADDVLSCCDDCGNCDGGHPAKAFDYWVNTGIVSGGPYGSIDGCRPYEIPPCGHPPNTPVPAGCHDGYKPPSCVLKCIPPYGIKYEHDLHFGAESYSVPSEVEAIQEEIYSKGPVVAVMQVYEDFLSYNGGVYHHVSGSLLGHRSVRILGWGTENGTDYWLCANAWGQWWGEQGFFKIRRGVDECGIRSQILAGTPQS